MAQLELRISGTLKGNRHKQLPTFLLWYYVNVDKREAVHAEGQCIPKAQRALSTVSKQSKEYIRLREAARSWWSRGKVESKLKVMFREQNKRKPRKDGMM